MRIARHLLSAALALGLTAQAVDARSFARPPTTAESNVDATKRARLKKVLSARRAKNVAAFKAYVIAGRYPRNTETPGDLNIWIDDEGRRCAAAQMIWASGARDLVEQQAARDNYVRLANVSDGPLLDWILTSGLTHDEVVLIQRPFMGRPWRPDLGVERPDAWQVADRAMAKKYKDILGELASARDASLDDAVDALMAHPDLAASLLRG